MKFPPPLRYSVPITLFLLGSLLGALSFFFDQHVGNRQVEALVTRHAKFIGNQISGIAAYLLGEEDHDGLRKQIAALGADPILRVAAVVNDEDRIVATTRFEYTGKTLDETPLALARPKMRKGAAPEPTLHDSGNRLLAVFPFMLPPVERELVSTRHAWLVLDYNVAHPKQQVSKALLQRSGAITLVLGATCFFAWLFLHRTLNCRIGRLVEATKRLARGEKQVRVAMAGTDEIAELSRAFNGMAEQISRSTEELRGANERMKQEIADRAFVEEALRGSEKRFRSIWENSREAMRLSDHKGTVLAANPAYCQLIKLAAHDVLEQPFTAAYQANEAEQKLEKYLEGFRQRRIQPCQQKRVTLHNGQALDLEMSYSFIDLDQERTLLLGVFRDVSDRVAVLEKLRHAKEFSENVIKTAKVIIIGVDAENRITVFNETAEQISGYTLADVQGRNWGELVRPLNVDCPLDAAETDSFETTFETKLITKKRDERTISWRVNPIFEDGKWAGRICFGLDYTEKKKQEEQRMALERKLLDSQKLESLGVLAGGIAHDFNNLLTAILGNANLASMQLEEGTSARNYLGNIEKTSLRAAELCKQMLAYSGKGRFAMQYLDLNEVVRETLDLLEVSITKKASLRVEFRPVLPRAYADPTQIRQVMMNLVINASEAIGDQAGMIRVRTGVLQADAAYFESACGNTEAQPGEYVFVEVSDTGCGMSPETQARIFDPFFTTKFTGRGLGLAAVLGIVRGHKGALKILSEVGKGSTFKFLLPVATVVPQPQTNRTTNAGANWKGSGTILVVDDDPTVRAVTSRMVEACGFEVLQAVDGRHGVEVFSEKRDQIRGVVLDMTMPNLNGQEAFQEMRRLKPEIKVLLMSGFSEYSTSAQFNGSSPAGFLQKPFRPEELNQKLKGLFVEESAKN
jgi:two-component system, cell cycle sensor histidine kinase and response regulator CckA